MHTTEAETYHILQDTKKETQLPLP